MNKRSGYKKAEQTKRYRLMTHLTDEERDMLWNMADENGSSLSHTLAMCLRYVAGLSELERVKAWIAEP